MASGRVRAGYYAEVDGVVWPAIFDPSGGPVGLLAYGDEPPGPEFEPQDPGGEWQRAVARSSCSRLFYVATSAYWLDVYPAQVERARGDGTVEIFTSPLGSFPAPEGHIIGLDWGPARRRLWEERLVGYHGTVPETELSHVVEVTSEIGTIPTTTWRQPPPPLHTAQPRPAGHQPDRRRRKERAPHRHQQPG